jgi:hypothetical protein
MKTKNITYVAQYFEKDDLGKDSFCVPYYLGKIYKMNVTIAYSQKQTNKDIPKELRGVKLVPIKFIKTDLKYLYDLYETLALLFYVIRNIRKIDVLMHIHLMHQAAFIGNI